MPNSPVRIPLINPNEPDAQLRSIFVTEGQPVSIGEPICVLETTKSTFEVESPQDGFVVSLRIKLGETAHAGELLCYIAESADWIPEEVEPAIPDPQPSDLPEGLRITQPALSLARKHNIDLRQFPSGALITEAIVRTALDKTVAKPGTFDPTAIIVYGGGGHGKSLIDLIRVLGVYRIYGIVDDRLERGTQIMGVPVLGGSEKLPDLITDGVHLAANAVGGIGNIAVRVKVFQQLAEARFYCPALVHPTAFIEVTANISAGVQVMPHAYIGSQSMIGYGSIINTGAIISHDCILGDFVNISPGAILAGDVRVGSSALVGMGVTINLQAKIGSGARIGNSATVKTDVPDNGIVRAGTIWPE